MEYRSTVVYSGNMIGKDYWTAGIILWWLLTRPHALHLLAVIEEASGVEDFVFDAIDSLGFERLVCIGNPIRAEGKFVELIRQAERDRGDNLPPRLAVNAIQIPSTDSPHAGLERSPFGLADRTWLETMYRKYGRDALWARSHICPNHLARWGITSALPYAGEGRPKDPSFVNLRTEAAWKLHNRLDVSHMRYDPPAGGRSAQTRTQPPFHFCPGAYYARLVEELRPLTYGLVGRKTKLLPKDQWSTILGHSPDVADALIQSMLPVT